MDRASCENMRPMTSRRGRDVRCALAYALFEPTLETECRPMDLVYTFLHCVRWIGRRGMSTENTKGSVERAI